MKLMHSSLPLFVIALFQICQQDISKSHFRHYCDPDLHVVVSEKRVWVVADEVNYKKMRVQIRSQSGEIMLEKNFNAKTTDWSFNIQSLPAGAYSVWIDQWQEAQFKKS
jgi:hypothetical protein